MQFYSDFSNSQGIGEKVWKIGAQKNQSSWKKAWTGYIPVLKTSDLSFERKQSSISNFSRTVAGNQTFFGEILMDFHYFSENNQLWFVQEHEVSSNVMGFRQYRKTWVAAHKIKFSIKYFFTKSDHCAMGSFCFSDFAVSNRAEKYFG